MSQASSPPEDGAAGAFSVRRLRGSDAPAVLEAFGSDPEMIRQGTVPDLAAAEQYVVRLVTNDAVAAWAIVDAGDRLRGLVAINVDQENRVGWFWYWMHASSRRRGVTARAATAVANWALTKGGLFRLELGHRANNPGSAGVARAAGFIQEGTERAKFLVGSERVDVLTYGRLASDPWPGSDPLLELRAGGR